MLSQAILRAEPCPPASRSNPFSSSALSPPPNGCFIDIRARQLIRLLSHPPNEPLSASPPPIYLGRIIHNIIIVVCHCVDLSCQQDASVHHMSMPLVKPRLPMGNLLTKDPISPTPRVPPSLHYKPRLANSDPSKIVGCPSF